MEERDRMEAVARTATAVGDSVSRFYEDVYELKTGLPADAVSGLEDRLKVNTPTKSQGRRRNVCRLSATNAGVAVY